MSQLGLRGRARVIEPNVMLDVIAVFSGCVYGGSSEPLYAEHVVIRVTSISPLKPSQGVHRTFEEFSSDEDRRGREGGREGGIRMNT